MQRSSPVAPTVTLQWPGKHTPAAPAGVALPLLETFEPLNPAAPGGAGGTAAAEAGVPAGAPAPGSGGWTSNLLFCADNRDVVANLLENGGQGRFRLIYADPPYNSGVAWRRKVRLRGPRPPGERALIDEQVQYDDAWDESAYLQFLYERLPLLRDLLAEDGTLWLHCDHRHAHHLRCLLEEVFGSRHYLNTITWRSQTARGAKVNAFYFPNSAHTILIFARNRAAPPAWNPPRRTLVLTEAEATAEFMRDALGFFRTSDPGTFSFESLLRLHTEGRLYAPHGGEVQVDPVARRITCSRGGNLGIKYYLTALADGRYAVERAVDNIWDDIPGLGTTPGEDLGYPTQKTEALLARIIGAATQPGDWVLDPFMGSGATLAVAARLGRRWVGCDVAYGAVQTARRRLQALAGPTPGLGFAVYGQRPVLSEPPAVVVGIAQIAAEPARIRVTIENVTWPQGTTGLAPGADWREAVDSIEIDPGGQGPAPRFAVADVPLKRTHLVQGSYELPAASVGPQITVRVTDIWGREALVTATIPSNDL